MKAITNTCRTLRPLLLATALFSASGWLAVQAEDLNQAVGKGVYELAVSPKDNALFVATAQNSSGDGGTVFRLDPATLAVQQSINTALKSFGAAINPQTNVLYIGNTVNGSVTAIDASSGKVLNTLVLDSRKRSETVRPLQPRQVAVDAKTNRVYITGLGPQSVVWVVDGSTLKLVSTIPNTGKMGTGLAVDSDAQRSTSPTVMVSW